MPPTQKNTGQQKPTPAQTPSQGISPNIRPASHLLLLPLALALARLREVPLEYPLLDIQRSMVGWASFGRATTEESTLAELPGLGAGEEERSDDEDDAPFPVTAMLASWLPLRCV